MKLLLIEDFEVYWQKRETSADYILRIKPKVDKDSEINKYFTVNGLSIIYPTTFGVIDTTITPSLYNVVLLVEEYNDNILNPNFPFIIQLQRKVSPFIEAEAPNAKNDITEGVQNAITSDFRTISSVDGNSAISLGSNAISNDVQGTRMTLSGYNEIIRNAPFDHLGVNVDTDGNMFTSTGVMNYIPSVLPFKAPTTMPDPSFITKYASTLQAVLKVTSALNEVSSLLT